jgi:hypothetical protein
MKKWCAARAVEMSPDVLSKHEIDRLLASLGGSMPTELSFKKRGKEIKQAIAGRLAQLQQRLDKRNQDLDRFLDDRKRVRSFLVRSIMSRGWGEPYRGGTVLYPKGDISSEEIEETMQLCRRIFDLEQEVYQLRLVSAHLDDEQQFDLSFTDLVNYGFSAEA